MSVLWFRYGWEIRSRSAFLLFFAAVLLFLGLLSVALTAKDTYHAHRLSTDGRMATATVVQKVLHRAASNGTADTSFEVDYVFTTADGRRFDGSDTVDADTWERIADRGPVEIQYSVSDPLINRIGATTGVTAFAIVFLVVGSALALLGALLAVKGLRSLQTPVWSSAESAAASAADGPPFWQVRVKVNRWIIIGGILLIVGVTFRLIGDAKLREERLYQAAGLTANAIVEAKSMRMPALLQPAQSQYMRRDIRYLVHYRFTSNDGATVRGSDEVDLRTWQSIREGDPIQIVYLRDQPARSRLVANATGMAPQQFIVLGGTLAAIGLLFLSYGLFRVIQKRRIGRHGPLG